SFRDDIFEVKDLKEGMICPGIVTNVTNFGAFVDIGVHQDGLVHISALSHKFVDDPRKVVNPGDQVTVKVLGIDKDKNQISLSMLLDEAPQRKARAEGEAGAPRPPRREGGREGDRPRGPRPEGERGSRPGAVAKGGPGGGGPRPQAAGGAGPRGPRPDGGDRGRHAGRSDQRPHGDQKRDQSRDHRPRGPATPFNNPFAALLGGAAPDAKPGTRK
ncbi:MAG: S1 RNA-binding domain-containing protein, partial [Bdellovibrionaceae bacterium]|nr:S1 RNA-binding domain-containing protein [Pseudobdellovibrionaceae bacterium]